MGPACRADPRLAPALASPGAGRRDRARRRGVSGTGAGRLPSGSRLAPAAGRVDLEPGMSGLGIGVDLVEVSEAQRLLDRWGERLLRRVLTEQEQAYVLRNASPAKHLAARLAAKEAVYKAL